MTSATCDGEEVPQPQFSVFSGVAFGFIALGALASLAGNAFLFWYRATPVIQVCQAKLLHLFCFGVLLVNLSGVPRVFNSYEPFSDGLCMAQAWVMQTALTFIIAVLTAKEWRTWRVRVYTAKFRSFRLPENLLLLYVASCLLVIWFILALWTALAPTRIDPCQSFECSSSDSFGFWTAICFQLVQTIAMMVVAWKNCNMGQIGGESIGIFITACSLSVVVVVFVVSNLYNSPTTVGALQATNANSIEAMIMSISIFIVSCVAITSIVFAKARYLHLDRSTVLSMFISRAAPTSGTSSTLESKQARSGTGAVARSEGPTTQGEEAKHVTQSSSIVNAMEQLGERPAERVDRDEANVGGDQDGKEMFPCEAADPSAANPPAPPEKCADDMGMVQLA